jgi:hypothetical protein
LGSPEGIGHGAVHEDQGLPSYHKGIMPRSARDRFGASRFRRSRRVEEAHPRFRRAD